MPSIDFCNRMDPRAHLANLPNPELVRRSNHTREDATERRRCRWPVPLAEPGQPNVHEVRGRPALSRRTNPRTATACRADLPRLDRSGHLMSRC